MAVPLASVPVSSTAMVAARWQNAPGTALALASGPHGEPASRPGTRSRAHTPRPSATVGAMNDSHPEVSHGRDTESTTSPPGATLSTTWWLPSCPSCPSERNSTARSPWNWPPWNHVANVKPGHDGGPPSVVMLCWPPPPAAAAAPSCTKSHTPCGQAPGSVRVRNRTVSGATAMAACAVPSRAAPGVAVPVSATAPVPAPRYW